MMQRRVFIAALLSIVAAANATILRVPEDYDNIQAAIDEANSGDTVVVAPGLYQELISFQGKAITVTSLDPNDSDTIANTIIDGSGAEFPSSVVTFSQGEYQDSVLTGFTITGGTGTPFDLSDAGQLLNWGAGIACLGASPTITRNLIVDNHGTLYPTDAASVIGYGGGIACIQSEAIIAYNTISKNSAYAVGAVFAYMGDTLIYNNFIYDNSAYVVGGVGLFGGQLFNNTIVNNSPAGVADGLPSEGQYGNLYLVYDAVALPCVVKNNIICSAKGGGGVVAQGLVGDWFAFNDVWNNQPSDYQMLDPQTGRSLPGMNLTGQYGNICEDPLFAGTNAHDFHLSRLSPCIQAGDPGFVSPLGETDLDGDNRIWGDVVDIGADEYPGCARPVANAGPDQRLYAVEPITLDGSASSSCDPCSPTLFRWTQVEGPTVMLSDPCTARPTFTPPGDGRYGFRLVISAGAYDSRPDEVVIRIGNGSPVAYAGEDRLCPTPSQVRLDGSGSSDPDDDRLVYHWRQTAGPEAQLYDANTATPWFACTEPGVYAFELIVNDGHLESAPDTMKITTMVMAVDQKAISAGVSTAGYFHYPDVDGSRVVYSVGPDINFSWDIVYRDFLSGQTQTFRSIGSGQDLDTQPRIQGDTIVWCGGPVYGSPWVNGPSNQSILAAKVGSTRIYTLRRYSMTSSYSHPAVWGTKVVWLEHLNLDLANGQVNQWWNTPFSICGADITNPDQVQYFTVAKDVGSRDPYACYAYDSDFDHVIDIWGNTVVWEANGDIFGADISDLNHIRVFPICTNRAKQYDPAIYGNTVVWTDMRNDGGDIYGADISQPDAVVEMALVKAQGSQTQPAIDGQIVVYTDGTTIKASRMVPGYGLTDVPLQGSPQGLGPAVSGETLVWQTGVYGSVQALSVKTGLSVADGPVTNATTGSRHPCIQDAITLATNGDSIVVAPGTYYEDVDLRGKTLTLTSEDPTNWDTVRGTVIDGFAAALTCSTGETGQTVIQGLTLTGAGTGVVCSGSMPVITQCSITANSGSGIVLRSRSAPTLDRCEITANGGAGIESISQPMPGRGVAIGNSPVITHCLIAGNRRQGINGDKPSVRNCTIVENGMEGLSSASFAATNSIVYFNGLRRVWPSAGLTYCDVEGGPAGSGNIDADPGFAIQGRWVQRADSSQPALAADPNAVWIRGDYRLTAGSPAVDQGDPATVPGPDETDLLGQPSIMGARIDMGAFERES